MPVSPLNDKSSLSAAKKKMKLLLIAGLVLIIVGLLMDHYMAVPPRADSQLSAQCRAELQKGGDAGVDPSQCDQENVAISFTANANGMDADSAARAISSANRKEVNAHKEAMFVTGLGIGLVLIGGLVLLQLTKKEKALTAERP